MEQSNDQVRMVLPCQCPHCGKDIVVKLDLPSPVVTGVVRLDEADAEIRQILNENNDNPKEPQAS